MDEFATSVKRWADGRTAARFTDGSVVVTVPGPPPWYGHIDLSDVAPRAPWPSLGQPRVAGLADAAVRSLSV